MADSGRLNLGTGMWKRNKKLGYDRKNGDVVIDAKQVGGTKMKENYGWQKM